VACYRRPRIAVFCRCIDVRSVAHEITLTAIKTTKAIHCGERGWTNHGRRALTTKPVRTLMGRYGRRSRRLRNRLRAFQTASATTGAGSVGTTPFCEKRGVECPNPAIVAFGANPRAPVS
jgi:hypothetical protein